MADKRYWGKNNQYGPYSAQEDGWPNAGEVIRDYRKRVKKWSAALLAKLYGEKIGENIGERWIQRMERDNLVPKELTRRRALASLLGIPPILLGLGALEDLHPTPTPSVVTPNKSIDVTSYTKLLNLYWQVDHTATAQHSLSEIERIITQLRADSALVSGSTQRQVFELLCGYYCLSSTIYADQTRYDLAYKDANDAVILATNLQNNKLLAMALYQRGFVRQEQGIFGANQQYLQEAVNDYSEAIPISTPKVEAHLRLDLALTSAYMKKNSAADANLVKAGAIVDRGGLDEGTFIDLFADLDKGRYRLGQAVVYTALKRYNDASDLLFEAKEKLNPAQTRRFAWADVTEARIYFGQRNYALAAQTALQALKVSKAIGSQVNVQLIRGLHSQLLTTTYGTSAAVRELGTALILP